MIITTLASFPSPPQGVWFLSLFGFEIPIRAYAICIIIGIIAALVIGDRRWAARGGERGVIYDIAMWAVPFGLVGGRLYHVMTDWQTYFGAGGAGPAAALRIWDGGLGIWGAVALGGVGAWIACRRRGIPLPAFGDAIAPGIVLAQAIGRVGNYFNQELYGRETTVPWGMEVFYRRDPSGIIDVHSLNGVSTGQVAAVVHPTFLYELLWNVLVFVALIYIDRRFKIGHGRLFALYVAGYCIGRFCVELLRDDFATHIAGVRINSFTATFVFIGAIVYFILATKGRDDPATLRGKDEETFAEELVEDLAAVAATTGVVAAATVANREDEDEHVEPESPAAEKAGVEPELAAVAELDADAVDVAEAAEVDQEPEPEVEAPVVDEPGVATVDEPEVEEPSATAATEPSDADDVAESEDEALLEAEVAEVAQEPEPEPEPEVEALEVAAVEEPEVEEPSATAATEPSDADDVAESEDEALLEAEVAGPGVEAEDADLIDEDHDPVDEEDLESLEDAGAVGAGPLSEQAEELVESDEEDLESSDEAEVPEPEPSDEAEPATEDVSAEDAEQAEQVAEPVVSDEPETAAEPEAAVAPEPESEPEPEPVADNEPEPVADNEPEAADEAEPEPEPEPAAEAEPEPKTELEPESSAEAEPVPSDEPAADEAAESGEQSEETAADVSDEAQPDEPVERRRRWWRRRG